MIPLTLADDIQRTLLDYLAATFNFQEEALEIILYDILVARRSQKPGYHDQQ